jgi:hypothetical protein
VNGGAAINVTSEIFHLRRGYEKETYLVQRRVAVGVRAVQQRRALLVLPTQHTNTTQGFSALTRRHVSDEISLLSILS